MFFDNFPKSIQTNTGPLVRETSLCGNSC